MFRKILVAVDETAQSAEALRVATQLARQNNGCVTLVHAFPQIADHLGSPIYEDLLHSATYAGQALLEHMQAEVGDDVVCDAQLLQGAPAEAILNVARTEKMDMIVMGTRGHGSLLTFLLGSVSNEVTHRAPCPVLVIH